MAAGYGVALCGGYCRSNRYPDIWPVFPLARPLSLVKWGVFHNEGLTISVFGANIQSPERRRTYMKEESKIREPIEGWLCL